MKRIKSIISLLVVAGLLTVGGVFASAASEENDVNKISSYYYGIGKKIKDIKEDKDKEVVIATINGDPVPKKLFESKKLFLTEAYMQVGKSVPSDEHILNEIAKEKLMYEEAQKRGLVVSDDKVKQMMNEVKEKTYKTKDEKRLAPHKKINEGLGIKEDEYWNDKETFEAYKRMLSVAKLRVQIISQMEIPAEKRFEPETALMIEEEIERFANGLIENAQISKI